MSKKRMKKLVDDICLSIKYSRLKEEMYNVKQEIEKGKGLLFKVKSSDRDIEKINDIIWQIKDNYKPNQYNLVEDNKIQESLNILSKRKDFETIKHNIAIRTILDNEIEYVNTTNYLNNVSKTLFNDESVIDSLINEFYNIYSFFNDVKIERTPSFNLSEIFKRIPLLNAIQIPSLILVGKQIIENPQKALDVGKKVVGAGKGVIGAGKKAVTFLEGHKGIAIAGAIALGLGMAGGVTAKLKKRKQINAIKKIDCESFECILITNALSIVSASRYMTKEDYQHYFKNKITEINLIRKKISRQLYVKGVNKEENSKNIILLNKFERYILDRTEFVNI